MVKRNGPSAVKNWGRSLRSAGSLNRRTILNRGFAIPRFPLNSVSEANSGLFSQERNSDAKLRASPRCEARLQQIKLSDQLAGGLVGEPPGAGNTVDFGPFGTKPRQTQPPLDLIDLARQ